MKFLKYVIVALLIVFVGIQFIPSELNQSNEILPSDFTQVYNVPESVKSILKVSCYDCHSNNTNYPWYNRVQPAKWFLEGHIKKGKEELNFSEFGEYSGRKQRSKLKSIASQVKDGEMPLTSYTLIHGNAKITESKKEILLNWINTLER